MHLASTTVPERQADGEYSRCKAMADDVSSSSPLTWPALNDAWIAVPQLPRLTSKQLVQAQMLAVGLVERLAQYLHTHASHLTPCQAIILGL